MHGDLAPYGCETIGKLSFSKSWQRVPAPGSSAASVPTISSPEAVQRQPCSFSSNQENRTALGAFAFCALSMLWFQYFGLLWFLDLDQRWCHTQLWSCCLKSILLLCHSQGRSCCSEGKGWREATVRLLGLPVLSYLLSCMAVSVACE